MKSPPLNTQGLLLLAETTFDGAGAFASTKRQQGVREQLGVASGWEFTNDGSDGDMTLYIEPAPRDVSGLFSNLILVANASSGALSFLARCIVGPTVVRVLVTASTTGAAVDLRSTPLSIMIVGAAC